LFFENSVLLAQILDRSLLVFVDPASENSDEELLWLWDPGHPGFYGENGNQQVSSSGGNTATIAPESVSFEKVDTTGLRSWPNVDSLKGMELYETR